MTAGFATSNNAFGNGSNYRGSGFLALNQTFCSSLAEIPAAFLGQLCDWASAHGMGHEDQDAPAADSIRHCHVLPDSPSVPFSMALSTSRIIFMPQFSPVLLFRPQWRNRSLRAGVAMIEGMRLIVSEVVNSQLPSRRVGVRLVPFAF